MRCFHIQGIAITDTIDLVHLAYHYKCSTRKESLSFLGKLAWTIRKSVKSYFSLFETSLPCLFKNMLRITTKQHQMLPLVCKTSLKKEKETDILNWIDLTHYKAYLVPTTFHFLFLSFIVPHPNIVLVRKTCFRIH